MWHLCPGFLSACVFSTKSRRAPATERAYRLSQSSMDENALPGVSFGLTNPRHDPVHRGQRLSVLAVPNPELSEQNDDHNSELYEQTCVNFSPTSGTRRCIEATVDPLSLSRTQEFLRPKDYSRPRFKDTLLKSTPRFKDTKKKYRRMRQLALGCESN